LPYKPDNLIEYSKRFAVGKHLHPFDDCWFGSVKDTANGDDTSFLLPKLTQRFHFVGGEKVCAWRCFITGNLCTCFRV
jgi:hypothetical protein